MPDLRPRTLLLVDLDVSCMDANLMSPTYICTFLGRRLCVRVPDPGVVARLGDAADGALRAGSPGHLSEMCRLKSPSPACRRLVLGLVIALGLRCVAVLRARHDVLVRQVLVDFVLRCAIDRLLSYKEIMRHGFVRCLLLLLLTTGSVYIMFWQIAWGLSCLHTSMRKR